MKKILILSLGLILTTCQFTFAQYSELTNPEVKDAVHSLNNANKTLLGAGLGVNAGLAFMESNTGIAIGVFAELEAGSFAFVPQANYWQVKKENNFELTGLVRLKFTSPGLTPYVDGGIGINFYNNNNNPQNDLSFQKLGINVGGGVILKNITSSFDLVIDGKYKIIINNDEPGNISGYTVTAGMRFPL